jgi:hypothetical protein
MSWYDLQYQVPSVPEDYMETPNSIAPHAKDYQNNAWQQYTSLDLGMWVHLLVTRSQHRKDKAKAAKDLYDAQNYLNMLQEHIEATKKFLGI